MKKLMVICLVMVMALSLVACGTQSSSETSQATESQKTSVQASETAESSESQAETKDYEIVVVPKDATIPWFVRMDEGVKEFAQDTGLNVYMKGPSALDVTQQIEVIEDLIAQDVDAICVVPIDPAALEPVLKKAMEKGIIVVTHEASSQENTMYDIEAFNNANYGAFIMDNLAEAMGEEGTYTIMVGTLTNASHNEWADGAIARQKEAYPNMQLLEAEPRVEIMDDANTTYEKAKELFKKYPDLKGIVGTSAHVVANVPKAIEELGLVGKVFVSGTGLPSQAGQYITDGTVKTMTLWDPADAGYVMCELAVKILNGEEITDGVDLGREGYESMKLNGKVLEGSGWITIDINNIDQYNF
jgi:simple sugar transport system substrate-binding protein